MTAVTATARDAPAPEARIRVMLVDDAVVVRGMVARILEREDDMEIVHSVVNGEEAIKAIKRAPVDFILLDVEMPVMDGLTALPLLIEAAPDTKPGFPRWIASLMTFLGGSAIRINAIPSSRRVKPVSPCG